MLSTLIKKHCFPCLKCYFSLKFCCSIKTITVHWLDKTFDIWIQLKPVKMLDTAMHFLSLIHISVLCRQCTLIVCLLVSGPVTFLTEGYLLNPTKRTHELLFLCIFQLFLKMCDICRSFFSVLTWHKTGIQKWHKTMK